MTSVPRRGNTDQPGATPREGKRPEGSRPERAEQVQAPGPLVSPLQGFAGGGRRGPGALPRADVSGPLRGMMSQTQWKVGLATPADSRLTGAGLIDKRPIPGRHIERGLQHPEMLITHDPAESLRDRVTGMAHATDS